jgi:integrase
LTSEIDDIRRQNEEILTLLKAPKKAEDVLTVEQWLDDSSINDDGRRNRLTALKIWTKSHGFDVEEPSRSKWKVRVSKEKVIKAANTVLEEIRSEKVTVYASTRKFMDYARKNYKPYPSQIYRSLLLVFFRACLGQASFNSKVMDTQAPEGDSYVSTEKKIPTREEFRTMLKRATPQYRAILGIGSLSGWRPNEIVSRKMSDLTELPWGGAKLKVFASQTKKRYTRYAFLTKEVVDWIKDYHSRLTKSSEYIFPGEDHKGDRTRDVHLHKGTAYLGIKALFEAAGLKDSEDTTEIYTQYSFRTFADSALAHCGMDRKYIGMIIGHKSRLAAEWSYKDWEAVEAQFKELCAEKLTWLTETIERIISNPETERQNRELRDANEKIQNQNRAILETLGHFLTPEQRKKLNLKLPYYSDAQIEKILEDEKALPDKSEEFDTKNADS